jgi:serine/threonine-protein kinase
MAVSRARQLAEVDELEVLNLHAQGGMAEVYRARVAMPDGREKLFAVKRILPRLTKDPELRAMFVEEARFASMVHCPQIVEVYDLVVDNDEYFMVMEFADGKDLAELSSFAAQRQVHVPAAVIMQVVRETLTALKAVHGTLGPDGTLLDLVHRDVSPHNIIVGYDGSVKLVDFGLAKSARSPPTAVPNAISGKLGYMSPEQARGEPADARSDLFQVGIVLYEGLAGRRLFETESDLTSLERVSSRVVPPLPQELDLPEDLEELMRSSLAVDPARRPQSADAFGRTLASIAERYGLLAGRAHVAELVNAVFPGRARQVAPTRGVRRVKLDSVLLAG